jgi:riboflavin biosynthesis pyrimidine reductase
MNESEHLLELYPQSGTRPLSGLYLGQDLRSILASCQDSLVYTNFVTSLDGRIALVDRKSGQSEVPAETANPRDWRLLLELSAPADVLIMSGRYLRDLASGNAQSLPPFSDQLPDDILDYRRRLGLIDKPALVFITRSSDIPEQALDRLTDRRILIATGDVAPDKRARFEAKGIEVMAFDSQRVDGRELIERLSEKGFRLIYSIAGPEVMHTLLTAGVLWRIYMTTVMRVLSGEEYATLAHGPKLDPVRDFELSALYLDRYGPDDVEQLLQVYTRKSGA